ncbi:MAG: hypothetical protein IJK23_13945 [Clostridia bacterium]|nr:hypothetical protein [Clostridia bacterium]
MKKIALFLSAVLALSAVFAAIPASAVNTEKIEGALYERLLSADDGDRFLIAVELTEHFDERSYMNAHADDGEPKDVRASLVNAAEEFYAALNRGFAEKIGGFATVVEISTLTPVILCEAQKKDVLTLSEYDEVLYISAGEALFPDSVSGAASEQDPTQNGIEIAGLPQNECRLLEGDLLVLLRPMTGDEFTAACPDLIPYRVENTFRVIPQGSTEPYPVYPYVRSVGSDPIATEDRVRSAEDDPEGPDPLLGIALLGDLNCDGKVQASDARLVLWCAAGLTQFGKRAPETETLANVGYEFLIAAADTDFDGKIKARDARAVLRAAAKIEPFVPGM